MTIISLFRTITSKTTEGAGCRSRFGLLLTGPTRILLFCSTLKLNAPPAAGLLPPNSFGSLGDEHFLASSEDGEAADGMRPPGGVWSQTGEERSAIWGAPRGGRGGRNF